MFVQDVNGIGAWRAVSQPNMDFAMLMMAWVSTAVFLPAFTDSNSNQFIVDLTADVLRHNAWDQNNVTSARMKAVYMVQSKLKRFFECVFSFNLLITHDERQRARQGAIALFNF